MKKLMFTLAIISLATAAMAAPTKGKKGVQAMAGNEDGPETTGREAKIIVDQMPKTGHNCCLAAPSIQGASMIGVCYQKPRRWIVI